MRRRRDPKATNKVYPIERPPNCVFLLDPRYDYGMANPVDRALDSLPRPNLVLSPAMDTDAGSGVVTGFKKTEGAGNTSTFTVESGGQKINLTASTGTKYSTADQAIVCSANEIVSGSINYFASSGSIQFRIACIWRDSGSSAISTSETIVNAGDHGIIKLENQTAPALTTSFTFRIGVRPVTTGDTGYVIFNTGLVVKGTTAQQISEPHGIITNAGSISTPLGWRFDRTDDNISYVNNPNIDIITATREKPLIISTFINSTITGLNTGYILAKNLDSVATIQYGVLFSNVNNVVSLYMNGFSRISTGANSIYGGNNYLVTFTWDGTVLRAYVNCKLVATESYSETLISRPNFRIGCRGANAIYFGGLIGYTFITYGAQVDEIFSFIRKTGLMQIYGITR